MGGCGEKGGMGIGVWTFCGLGGGGCCGGDDYGYKKKSVRVDAWWG